MRILQVSNFFKPSWETGGVTKANYELSKSLVKKGHDVTVYTTDGYSSRLDVPKNQAIEVDGIKVYYFYNLFRILVKKLRFPIPYYLPFILHKEIKSFDVIHIHEHRTFLEVVVHYYAKKHGIPYVLQPRGSLPSKFGKKKLKSIFDLIFGHSVIKNARLIIASSEHESSYYWDDFPYINPNKVIHIPNGINIDDFKYLPVKGKLKSEFSLSKDDKVILFLGRINEIKGLEILIEAFANIKTQIKNVKLVIAGPNSGYLNELKSILNHFNLTEDVILTGPIYDKQKLEAFVDADVFVLPSKYESFGNVVFEACACGTPVVVTDRCGVSQYVNEKMGYVIKYNKSVLTEVLIEILSNDDLRRKLSITCKTEVNYNYSWDNVCSDLLEIYSNLSKKESL